MRIAKAILLYKKSPSALENHTCLFISLILISTLSLSGGPYNWKINDLYPLSHMVELFNYCR